MIKNFDSLIKEELWTFQILDNGKFIIASRSGDDKSTITYDRNKSEVILSPSFEKVPIGLFLKMMSLSSTEMGHTF